MFLTSITTLVVFIKTTEGTVPIGHVSDFSLTDLNFNATTILSSEQNCPDFGEIENGVVKITDSGVQQMIAVVECNDGYDLDGDPAVYCIKGKWETRPQCNKRCYPPPYLQNGSLEIEGEKDEKGLFHKGTLATYSCGEGFRLTPKESQYRVCEKGIWTGAYATCEPIKKITSCPAPKDINNGYFVHEKTGEYDGNNVGQRLHYSCNTGYVLIGTTVQQCLEDGTWSPKIPPACSLQISGE